MYKKLAIQTIIYSIGLIFPKIVNYFFLKIFTEFLKREEFSLYTDMYSLSFLIIGFLSLGLENTYFRFIYKKNYNKKVIFSTGIIMQLLITSIFFIISTFLIKEISDISGYKNHPEYLSMFFLIIFFDTICILPMAWLRVNNKAIYYASVNVINILIQSFFIIYMFYCYKNNLFCYKSYFYVFNFVNSITDKTGSIFFSNVISSVTNLFLVFPIFLKEVRIKKFNKILAKKMLNYGIPIMLGTIAFSINENMDKVLIKRWISDEINGAYSACYKIASFMSLYVRIFRLGVEPFFFKKSLDSNARYYYEEITYIFILLGLIFYVLICGNLSIFMKLLIDKKYHIAISIIPIIMMGNLFLGIYNNLSISYKIIDKPIIGTYISLIGVLITFLFNIIFIINISNKNFMIPAWGTFTSYGCMLFTLFIWGKGNLLNFCIKKTKNIIFYFIFSIFLVFITNKNKLELNIILQFLYFLTIFFLEKRRFINLIKIK
ncbi:lipopolysaccharide biosynthesis protein [Blattabacterium cuenoti]|uniref:lipopolysaccharide biosynthesis protein n=1 Tax=Blattabacterium cuenoti TaxID=1653831 RepID=UPI00163D2010|nr:oligosaccharide flippase family protein [Blattabacterium cuenoti]